NRNHFASFLAMCAPYPAAYAFAVLHRSTDRQRWKLRPVTIACGALSISAFILLAIMRSLSLMGFAAALVALFVCGAALAYSRLNDRETSRRSRLAIVGTLPVAVST